ncbi:YncE family protein [Kiloniella laminariae]|uniref:YncE family protein n=1 Tax=Kiloniella laminariae TaxID=454162 RepID=A0ABT4LHU4_9PROT|nr:YncE family protein [Kiloniella laminariae]MCZ4279931.1 YncE family protein [Kiloniella laminariae]
MGTAKTTQQHVTRRSLLKGIGYGLLTWQTDVLFRQNRAHAQNVGREIKVIDLKGEHPGVPTLMPDDRTLVSVNQESSNLSLVDMKSYKLIDTISLSGKREPWEIAFTPSGKLGFVSHSAFDGDQEKKSFVTVVDMKHRKEIKQIPVGLRPNGVAVDKKGQWAFVANMGSNSVSVISVDELKVVEEIKVGRSPFDLAVTPDNRELLVVNFYDSSLSVISMDNFEVLDVIPTGTPGLDDPYPEFGGGDSCQIAVHPETGKAYVSNYRTHEIAVVDMKKRRVEKMIPTIKYPFGIQIEPKTNILSVLSGESRKLAIIDLGVSKALSNTLKLRETPMSEQDRQELEAIAAAQDTVIETIPLGKGGGKPPLRIPTSRAQNVTFSYVDPLRGFFYVIPAVPDAQIFGVQIAASSSHSGA